MSTGQIEEYDYIVVGTGSGGGFVALRLSEDPSLKILVLEAGGTDRHWTTTIPAGTRYNFDGGPRNWAFEGEPEPHLDGRRIFQPRGKVLGGSSSLNGMVFVRGHKEDYAEWVEAGATGWGYEDVLPWFKSMETYSRGVDHHRGGSGPIKVEKLADNHPIEDAFLEAGTAAGYAAPEDYNGAEQEGVSAFDANIHKGYRSGTARECVRPASERGNVTLLTGAHVTRIILDGKRATGVSFRHNGEDVSARASCEVVLCAGAFQTPQLLMLSGIGPAEHLAEHDIKLVEDLPGVGQGLQDHLEAHIKFDCPHRGMSKNKLLRRHRILMAGLEWYLFKTGPAATTPSRVGGFFRSHEAATHPDIQFHFWPYRMDGWTLSPDVDGYSFDVGPVKTKSRGWVKLRSSDPFAAPRICVNALSEPEDFKTFRAAIRIAREIAAQKAFGFCRGPELEPGPNAQSDDDLDAYIKANANSAYHPCGTARMGDGDMAVTDPEGKVHGIEGLRIADASLIPSITNGNINAPSMMIGERIAHMILGKARADA